jgi:hypothetical protein
VDVHFKISRGALKTIAAGNQTFKQGASARKVRRRNASLSQRAQVMMTVPSKWGGGHFDFGLNFYAPLAVQGNRIVSLCSTKTWHCGPLILSRSNSCCVVAMTAINLNYFSCIMRRISISLLTRLNLVQKAPASSAKH